VAADDRPFVLARAAADGAVPEAGILSRTLANAGGVKVTLFGFAAGEELTEHTSPRAAIVQVVAGEADFAVAGETLRLVPGDVLTMEGGVRHGVLALSPLVFTLTLLPRVAG